MSKLSKDTLLKGGIKIGKPDQILPPSSVCSNRTGQALHGRSLADVVEEALKSGVTFLQLRERDIDTPSLLLSLQK